MIYLLVCYYPDDREAGKSVETCYGYFLDKTKAETKANELNKREGVEEKYFVRPVSPAKNEN